MPKYGDKMPTKTQNNKSKERITWDKMMMDDLATYNISTDRYEQVCKEIRMIPEVNMFAYGIINPVEAGKTARKVKDEDGVWIEMEDAKYGLIVGLRAESADARSKIDALLKPLGLPYVVDVMDFRLL